MSTYSASQKMGNGILAFLCTAIGLYGFSYLFIRHGFFGFKGDLAYDTTWQIAFHMHFLGGGAALLSGWSQFFKNWRDKHLSLHRTLGKIYVAAILLVSGPGALYLAFHANGGFNNVMGFGLMAITWIGFTYLAYSRIRQGNVDAHKRWMIRSFAVTMAAVTLRFLMPIMIIGGVSEAEAYQAVSWLCWVPNLFVAEWIIPRMKD